MFNTLQPRAKVQSAARPPKPLLHSIAPAFVLIDTLIDQDSANFKVWARGSDYLATVEK